MLSLTMLFNSFSLSLYYCMCVHTLFLFRINIIYLYGVTFFFLPLPRRVYKEVRTRGILIFSKPCPITVTSPSIPSLYQATLGVSRFVGWGARKYASIQRVWRASLTIT